MSADHVPPITAHLARGRRLAALALVPAVFGACDWFTDFKEQPKIDPWESASDSMPYRGNPQGSVPITGSRVPGFAVSYAPLPGTIDSMAGIANPVSRDARSLQNGQKYYQINCTVCHGPAGWGNGPAVRYGVPSINIIMPITRGRTDGYLYGMIRNGRGLMPPYNRIEDLDRWDVVNYVRVLQSMAVGGAGAGRVDTMPVGFPGQTGGTLPGASATGPTRPPPYYGPHTGRSGGVPGGAGLGADTTGIPRSTPPGLRPEGDTSQVQLQAPGQATPVPPGGLPPRVAPPSAQPRDTGAARARDTGAVRPPTGQTTPTRSTP